MPANRPSGTSGDEDAPPMTTWERLKYAMVKPDEDADERPTSPYDDMSVEELQTEIRYSTDKERTIGLVAAPVAAVVGIIISSASIDNARTHHQSLAVYDELTYVLLGLAILVLVASLLRRRLFQGITLALFGVAVFQLKYNYIGFAAPFVLAGSWYLVRAYRLQQALKRAEAGESKRSRSPARTATGSQPRANRRYTPPT